MRGYPILSDDLPGRLEDLEKRIARLEQPHNIVYAERFGWIARSSFQSRPTVGDTYSPMDGFLGVMKSPSAMWAIEGDGTTDIDYNVRYFQFSPTPANDNVILASGTIDATAGPQILLIDTVAEGIVGTFGLLILEGKGPVPFSFAYYTLLDSGFITPEYQIVTS